MEYTSLPQEMQVATSDYTTNRTTLALTHTSKTTYNAVHMRYLRMCYDSKIRSIELYRYISKLYKADKPLIKFGYILLGVNIVYHKLYLPLITNDSYKVISTSYERSRGKIIIKELKDQVVTIAELQGLGTNTMILDPITIYLLAKERLGCTVRQSSFAHSFAQQSYNEAIDMLFSLKHTLFLSILPLLYLLNATYVATPEDQPIAFKQLSSNANSNIMQAQQLKPSIDDIIVTLH